MRILKLSAFRMEVLQAQALRDAHSLLPEQILMKLRVCRFLFMKHKQDYSVTSVKDVKGCF
jgi:hypothetical protein